MELIHVDAVLQWVSHYGHVAIFCLLVLGIVGLPVPDETLLTFSGYLVFTGRFHFASILIAAFLGSACGITISYLLGRAFGLTLVHRYGRYVHFNEDQLHKVHDWFERIGRWSLTVGYYIPGVRHFTAYVAGASRLEWPEFALFAYSGAFVWALSFISLGYFLGEQWSRVAAEVEHHILVACVAAAVLLLVYFIFRRVRAPRNRPN